MTKSCEMWHTSIVSGRPVMVQAPGRGQILIAGIDGPHDLPCHTAIRPLPFMVKLSG